MDRATSPVVGVVLLIGLTVIAAAGVGIAVTATTTEPPPTAAVDLSADADTDRIALTHRGGDRLDVSELTVHVTVDGDPLAEQPPVPFFAATGFRAGPTGPFNPADSQQFHAGDTASFRLASTNHPQLTAGATVSVELRTEHGVVARASTVAH